MEQKVSVPKVSVIIPCYNQGQYLKEAVDSVLASTYENIEIIVINDGSTEDVDIIKNFSAPKTKVIHQENQGVCNSRNNAIKAASGKYILPLDADDKIHPEYIEKAVKIHENNEKIGIVYCKAEYFGKKKGEWEVKDYKFPDCLWKNEIFNSAMYKKSDWEAVGGYNPQMKYGNEDWEFWLSLIERGVEVYKISEVLFYYRQGKNTRSKELEASGNQLEQVKQLMKLHPNLYIDNLASVLQPLTKILAIYVPRKQLKGLYSVRMKIKLWANKMLYILVGNAD